MCSPAKRDFTARSSSVPRYFEVEQFSGVSVGLGQTNTFGDSAHLSSQAKRTAPITSRPANPGRQRPFTWAYLAFPTPPLEKKPRAPSGLAAEMNWGPKTRAERSR